MVQIYSSTTSLAEVAEQVEQVETAERLFSSCASYINWKCLLLYGIITNFAAVFRITMIMRRNLTVILYCAILTVVAFLVFYLSCVPDVITTLENRLRSFWLGACQLRGNVPRSHTARRTTGDYPLRRQSGPTHGRAPRLVQDCDIVIS